MSLPENTKIGHCAYQAELNDYSRVEITTVLVPPYHGLIVIHWYANELNWPIPDRCFEIAVVYDHSEFAGSTTHDCIVTDALNADPTSYQALIDEIMESLLMCGGVKIVSHTYAVRT